MFMLSYYLCESSQKNYLLFGWWGWHDLFIRNQENVPRNGVRGRLKEPSGIVGSAFSCISCFSRTKERQV